MAFSRVLFTLIVALSCHSAGAGIIGFLPLYGGDNARLDQVSLAYKSAKTPRQKEQIFSTTLRHKRLSADGALKLLEMAMTDGSKTKIGKRKALSIFDDNFERFLEQNPKDEDVDKFIDLTTPSGTTLSSLMAYDVPRRDNFKFYYERGLLAHQSDQVELWMLYANPEDIRLRSVYITFRTQRDAKQVAKKLLAGMLANGIAELDRALSYIRAGESEDKHKLSHLLYDFVIESFNPKMSFSNQDVRNVLKLSLLSGNGFSRIVQKIFNLKPTKGIARVVMEVMLDKNAIGLSVDTIRELWPMLLPAVRSREEFRRMLFVRPYASPDYLDELTELAYVYRVQMNEFYLSLPETFSQKSYEEGDDCKELLKKPVPPPTVRIGY